MASSNPSLISSREHVLHMLAEASELEHNLLCSYLYAAFSLKTEADGDLSPEEQQAVTRWRAQIMRVCMEEMTHLAQVANLMVALGSRPHFDRPNLPVSPGYHPAKVQVVLAPFDAETLQHFIFLERPETSTIEDAAPFRGAESYERSPEVGILMPSAPDYATIGEFYEMLTTGLAELSRKMGEERLFVGSPDHQLRPEEIGSRDLSVVTDLASATEAIRMIVVQGEGAPGESDVSHFEKFLDVQREFDRLRSERPGFKPARNVARNPVMRRPIAADRVHITGVESAPILDACNAVYSLMLRCLAAVYDLRSDDKMSRKVLLGSAIGLMKVLAQLSDVLTRLPAAEDSNVCAGVTFAVLRSTEGLAPGVDVGEILGQRFEHIIGQVPKLGLPREVSVKVERQLGEMLRSMRSSS